jgi:hypothetical protein
MRASTFVAEPDRSRLTGITSIRNLELTARVNLKVMTTVDFASIAADEGIDWHEGEPIRFDAETGIVVNKVSAEALELVIRRAPQLDHAHQQDVRSLEDFLKANGGSEIYEFTPLPDWSGAADARSCAQCGADLLVQTPIVRSRGASAPGEFHALCIQCAESYDENSSAMIWAMGALMAVAAIGALFACVFPWIFR